MLNYFGGYDFITRTQLRQYILQTGCASAASLIRSGSTFVQLEQNCVLNVSKDCQIIYSSRIQCESGNSQCFSQLLILKILAFSFSMLSDRLEKMKAGSGRGSVSIVSAK